MWFLTFLCISLSALATTRASAGSKTSVLKKCCAKNNSLVKVTEINYNTTQYECVDSVSAVEKEISYFSHLIVADSVDINYGFPENCDDLRMVSLTETEVELTSADDICYDKLVSEIINGTVVQNIHKIVSLNCIRNNTDEKIKTSDIKIFHIRKCCPVGQEYDAEFHSCRDVNTKIKDKWAKRLFDVSDNNMYDVDYGLYCKKDEYSVELIEDVFSLHIEGDTLKHTGKNGRGEVPAGDWCVDTEFASQRFMARVCTQDCSLYGAFCVRKCCAMGQHYKPFSCNSFRSACVANTNEANFFNLSSYLDPLKSERGLLDVLGIRVGIRCPHGKFALNKSAETDWHRMNRYGELEGPKLDFREYCIETFDLSDCTDGENAVLVTALSCFLDEPVKDFFIAAVTNSISAVCLAVTLLVYCSLPELRNLHGRTIICHVTTMLVAYTCLARVQYHKVENSRLCIFLGYGIYFGFVAAFVWLNVMCLDIWWTFGSIRSVQPLRKTGAERRRFIWYSLYAWGVSFILTLVMFLFDTYPVTEILKANIGDDMCWFGSVQNSKGDWPHYIFFVVPMGLMTCVNLVLWLLTARHCARVKSEVHRLQAGSVGDRAKKRFRVDRANYVLTGKLWVVMGAGWFSELLATLTNEPQWLWMVVDLINQLQGLFIFLILVVKPKIYYLIRKRLGLEKPDGQKNGTSSGRTSSTFFSRTISTDERNNLRASLPNNGVKTA